MTPHAVVGQLAAVGFAVGCLALTAMPQQQPDTRSRTTTATSQDTARSGVHFIAFGEMDDADVVNQNGDEIGTIKDVIVERGSNRAKFYVVQSDDWAGLGGRLTAIPVDAFGWDAAENRPMLNATNEQLATLPEFTKQQWDALARGNEPDNDLGRALARESSWSNQDPYLTGDQGSLETISLKGNIVQVERRDADMSGEEIVLHIDSTGDHFGEDGHSMPNATDRRGTTDRPEATRPRPSDSNRGTTSDDSARGTQNRPQPNDTANNNRDVNDDNNPRTGATSRDRNDDARRTTRGANGIDRGDVKVVLGPSWYVMSRPEAPMRGYTFEGEVVRMPRATDEATYLAISAKINGKDLPLRDERTMRPLWAVGSSSAMDRSRDMRGTDRPSTTDRPSRSTDDKNRRGTDQPYGTRPGDPDPQSDDRHLGDEGDGQHPGMTDDEQRRVQDTTRRATDTTRRADDTLDRDSARHTAMAGRQSVRSAFFLLSEVDGANVECRGQSCGEVSDIILDQPSGTVAFYVIDPDENFLGIADTNRLVPATAANLGSDGVLRVDASKEMVLKSKELPDDLRTLEQGNGYQQIYSAYELDAPKFQPARKRDMSDVSSMSGWGHDGELAKAINSGRDVQIEGTVVRIERKAPAANMATGTALVLNTEQGNRYVLLGPSWFVDQQDIPFEEGDRVQVTAREATINGQKMLVACKAHGEGGREIAFWDTDSKQPAWDRRR